MEAWLSELEMELNEETVLHKDLAMQNQETQQENMDTFDEELALIFGETNISLDPQLINTASNNYNNDNILTNLTTSFSVEQLSPMFTNGDNNGDYNEHMTTNSEQDLSLADQQKSADNSNGGKDCKQQDGNIADNSNGGKDCKQQDGNVVAKRKRKREPNQVYDHIMAERKRRELLAQRFIALSAIVPGLKRVDKTSILGEAISYLQQLQEKVKTLEEASAATEAVESMVVVKRMQLMIDGDDVGGDNDSSCTIDDNSSVNFIPEIEVKYSNTTLLLRVYCVKRKGISAKVFTEVEKHDMVILNGSIVPFGSSTINITIVAQAEKADNNHVKSLVKTLYSVLRAP